MTLLGNPREVDEWVDRALRRAMLMQSMPRPQIAWRFLPNIARGAADPIWRDKNRVIQMRNMNPMQRAEKVACAMFQRDATKSPDSNACRPNERYANQLFCFNRIFYRGRRWTHRSSNQVAAGKCRRGFTETQRQNGIALHSVKLS